MLVQELLLLLQQALVRPLLRLPKFSLTRKFAKCCWLRGVHQKPGILKHKREAAPVLVTLKDTCVRGVSAFWQDLLSVLLLCSATMSKSLNKLYSF